MQSFNIKNIKIGAHESEKPQSNFRTVYIECDYNLTDPERENLQKQFDQKFTFAKVYMETSQRHVRTDKGRITY